MTRQIHVETSYTFISVHQHKLKKNETKTIEESTFLGFITYISRYSPPQQ